VQGLAEAIGWIERRQYAHVMAAAEELFGERFHVAIDPALISPRIWRD
jgi:hypothetical protein